VTHNDNSAAIAAALRQVSRSIADVADLLDGNIPGDSDRVAREAATLYEFDVPPEQGLSRVQASAAFKKHGLNPRSFGSWVQGGYLARDGDRRWLTDVGRKWADSKTKNSAATPGRLRGPGSGAGSSGGPCPVRRAGPLV
jgi:hypothetical protein